MEPTKNAISTIRRDNAKLLHNQHDQSELAKTLGM